MSKIQIKPNLQILNHKSFPNLQKLTTVENKTDNYAVNARDWQIAYLMLFSIYITLWL